MSCDAKIAPFPDKAVELRCAWSHDAIRPGTQHQAILRDYAYPGSESKIVWEEGDRRTYRGGWVECPAQPCVLPANHPGRHAP